MNRSTTRGRHGDFLRICDRSGRTVWASDTVKEWNGSIVYNGYAEPRHPQDLLRPRRENFGVPDARPEPVPQFTGPLMTETAVAASAGATALVVANTQRMMPGDSIGVYLASGDLHRNTIDTVTDLENLTLIDPLPGAVDSGAKVINFSAVAS